MVDEARLEATDSGLTPASEGWFVVNVSDAAWRTHEKFGASCRFESQAAEFADLGVNIRVLEPGQPNCYYHGEGTQEDFLVLFGECLLLVEGNERRLRAWDFVHCPAGTEHVFIGAGTGPCALLMTGARKEPENLIYPALDLALAHGAGVEHETTDPGEAYAAVTAPTQERPPSWDELPWS